MKRSICIISVMVMFVLQMIGQTFDYVKKAGGPGYDWGTGLVTDNQGNIFITGYFSANCSFDTIDFSSNGCFDIYLVKLTQNGTVLWGKSFGGFACDYSTSICIDDNQNIYVAGFYAYSSLIIGDTVLSSGDEFNAFLAKFDNNGNFIWAKSIASTGDDEGLSLKYKNGSIYFSGEFGNTINLDTFSISSNGLSDAFIARIDTSGTVIWIRTAGGTGYDSASGVTVDDNGNIYISGTFSDSVNFGPFQVISNGGDDIFICKYDSAGTEQWIRTMGGVSDDQGSKLATDHSGNVYIVCRISYDFSIDSFSFFGYRGFMILKFDSNGSFKWLNQAYAAWDSGWSNIITDNNDNLFLCGEFSDTVFIENDTIIGTGMSTYQGCIARYTTDGHMVWFKYNTGWGACMPACIYASNDSVLWATGMFSGLVLLDDQILSPTGGNDIFVARLSNIDQLGVVSNNFGNDVSLYPNPAKSNLTLEFKYKYIKEFEIIIYNSLGSVISSEISHDNIMTINIGNLPSGLYFVNIFYENNIIAKKFIKD